MVTCATPMDGNTSLFATWNLMFVFYYCGRNNSGIDLKHFIDMTLLLAPVSIRNLNLVLLIDASAYQASPDFIFNKTTSALGLERIV